ncbi:MAG: hypothetical protein EOM55_00760 [Clostridia bacterium]|nr:hypothetical protein [Clostridia bacterium]
MNYILSLDNYTNINYMFTTNQYVLLLIGLVIVAFFSLYFFRKRFSYQKIFVLVISIILIFFEICRIIWRYLYLEHNFESLTFVNIVDLNFSTICVWLTIILSLFAFFQKKNITTKTFGLSFVFSVATFVCFISLIYPVGLNSNFEFYHCYNLLFTLTRTLVILLGVSFACSGWISVGNFLDVWSAILSLLFFGALCFFVGKILGESLNLLYVNYLPLFEDVGMRFLSPIHYLFIGVFFFIFQSIIYAPFRFYNYFKNKNKK